MAGVKFTRGSAQRIADVVREVEGAPRTGLRYRGRSYPSEGWRLLIGKTDASLTKGNSGTISIWDGTTQSSFSDTGDDITAYNRFADISSSKWVAVKETVRGYEIIMAEC